MLIVGGDDSGKNAIFWQKIPVIDGTSIESTFTLGPFVVNETVWTGNVEHSSSQYSHLEIVYNNIHKEKTKEIEFDDKNKFDHASSTYLYEVINYNVSIGIGGFNIKSKNTSLIMNKSSPNSKYIDSKWITSKYRLLTYAYIRSCQSSDNDIPIEIIKLIDGYFGETPRMTSYIVETQRWNQIFEYWNVSVEFKNDWHKLFKYVHGIIFVVDLSSYNEYINVDNIRCNRLSYALHLWELTVKEAFNAKNKYNCHLILSLFANNIDLFNEKLKTIPLNECVEFKDYDASTGTEYSAINKRFCDAVADIETDYSSYLNIKCYETNSAFDMRERLRWVETQVIQSGMKYS